MAPSSSNTRYHPYKKLRTADPPLRGWLETMVRLGVCRPYHLLHKILHNSDAVTQQSRLSLKGVEFLDMLHRLSFLTSEEMDQVKYGEGLPVKVLDIEGRVYDMKLGLPKSNKQCRLIQNWMKFVENNQLEAVTKKTGEGGEPEISGHVVDVWAFRADDSRWRRFESKDILWNKRQLWFAVIHHDINDIGLPRSQVEGEGLKRRVPLLNGWKVSL